MRGPVRGTGAEGTRDVVSWCGVGLLIGALSWLLVVIVVNDGGVFGESNGWWVITVLLAFLVLWFGVTWRRGSDRPEPKRYVLWMCPAAGLGLLVTWFAFPQDAFEATTRGPWAFDPSPMAVHLWLVVCAIALGCVLMLLGLRGPVPRPLRRTLPSLALGTSAVLLAGALAARFLVPWVPHHVAEDLADPASVPTQATQVGWEWRPPMDTEVREVRAGAHGPLVLLWDGAVALDGTTGERLWSYRRPHGHVRDVWAENEYVHVRHRVATDQESGEERFETVVLDALTGRIVEEASTATGPPTGWLFEHGHDLARTWLDLPEACTVHDARGYGRRLVGVFDCPDGEDGSRTSVVALDSAEETELWRMEWTGDSTGPRLDEVPTNMEQAPIIVRYGPKEKSLVLDPETGEEVAVLPEEPAGDGSRELVYAGSDGTVTAEDTGDLETTFHRADASGRIIEEAVLTDTFVGYAIGSSRIAVLDEALLISRELTREDETSQARVQVVPFGRTTRWGEGTVLDSGWTDTSGVRNPSMTMAPGAVVLLTGEEENQLVEGLLP